MTLHVLLLLAIVQGITEFLPISSSGHLVLVPYVVGESDQGLVIDVAAHVGSLLAVVLYFHEDTRTALSGVVDILRGNPRSAPAKLAICLCAATVPVVLAGAIVWATGMDALLRDLAVIGLATLGFGLILLLADQRGRTVRKASDWQLRDAVVMGLWQVAAIVPGASRSGVTMTGARTLGYRRKDAAKLSMLMSIPTILAAGTLAALDVAWQAEGTALRDGAIVALMSFVAALLAIRLMMSMLERFSFTPFVIYRILLGLVLLGVAWL